MDPMAVAVAIAGSSIGQLTNNDATNGTANGFAGEEGGEWKEEDGVGGGEEEGGDETYLYPDDDYTVMDHHTVMGKGMGKGETGGEEGGGRSGMSASTSGSSERDRRRVG